MALSFEFVNGFHDTANAVATVIYTHSLPPVVAVVWSGLWNLIGVLRSSGAVAFSIIALLPVELVLNVGSGAGFAMVFALLISAIIWNVGTWYLGLPASSSHTLIGSIMGVGLANSLVSPGHVFGEGVNWAKANEVFTTLLISPIVGFICSAVLLLLVKVLIRKPELFQPAHAKKSPPWWIRGILILTCTGVSFAHGSNDGQKGMGLIMLILVGIMPAVFALNLQLDPKDVAGIEQGEGQVAAVLQKYVKDRPADQKEAEVELSAFLKTTGKLTRQNVWRARSDAGRI
jgi:PiT family inorganic phosphate transporter